MIRALYGESLRPTHVILCLLLPESSTGELRWLHATLGASMPYRQAMYVMRLLSPTNGRDSHVTVRN